MTLPLSAYPIVSTQDTDEAEATLCRELVDLRFEKVQQPNQFRLQMNGLYLGQTLLGYNRFNTDTWVDAGRVEDAVVLVIGHGPAMVTYVDGEPVVCTEQGPIISPTRTIKHFRRAGSGAFVIRTETEAIERRLQAILGRRPGKTIVFDTCVDFSYGVGAQARHLLRFLVDTLMSDDSAMQNPLLRTGYDDMLLNMLLALPNNYSDAIVNGRQPRLTPRPVLQAEAFLEANATEPVTISDLVAVCECSAKALFEAFRRHRGYTPMQFLANCRLEIARKVLAAATPGTTVTEVAYASGFSHLGRFANAYRGRFGECPSETLRKSRILIGK